MNNRGPHPRESCFLEKERDMSIVNHVPMIKELLRDKPALPSAAVESLRKVLGYLMDEEGADYNATPMEAREGHIFRDLHLLDCWLSQHEPCDGWDFPTELKHLGEVMASPEVLQHVSYEELQRILDEHRMTRWWTGPDIAVGGGNLYGRNAIRRHDGTPESYPEIGGIEFRIATTLTTATTIRVIRKGKAASAPQQGDK
jgi:hypothetical protein